MKQSGKVALGGILAALSLIFMFLTIFPYATYALPAIAGAVLIPIVVELGVKWGWMVYAAVSVLSLFIAPSMEAKVMFIAFFGYYPVLKASLEKIHNHVLEWIIKLAVFNVTMVVSYWLMLQFFGLEADAFEVFGVNVPYIILAAGNVVFLVYDMALTNVITAYIKSLHPRLSRMFK